MNSIICLASAGSGKTRMLIEQVKNFINNGGDPSKILIISYTKNAVEEIMDRLNEKDNIVQDINFHTFHSFCLEYLMENYGLNAIQIMDKRPNLTHLLPISLLENLGSPWEINNLLDKISIESLYYSYFNKNLYESLYPFEYFQDQWKWIQQLVTIIDFLKNTLNIWTFNDIVVTLYDLLQGKNATNHLFNLWNRYDGIFIDETQDFSPMQLEILLKMFKEIIYNFHSINSKKFFFIFGDPKQSIFNFQGASLESFHGMINDLTTTANNNKYPLIIDNIVYTHRLSINNVNFINDLFSVIKMEDFTAHKTLSLVKGNVYYRNPLPKDNIENTVKIIGETIDELINNGTNPNDIMIIFRSRDQLIYNLSDWLKSKNYSNGLDVITTYNSIFIKLMNDIYQLINNEDELLYQDFIANYGFYHLDPNTIELVINNIQNKKSYQTIIEENLIIKEFFQWIINIKNPLDINPYDFIMDILKLPMFYPIVTNEDKNILFNILESSKNFNGNWVQFNQWLPNNFKKESSGVKMETVYGSKGLQSKIVIIADGHKGPIGSSWQYQFIYHNTNGSLSNFLDQQKKNLWLKDKYDNIFNEYLRLMYVATTRAQESLYIFGSFPLEQNSLLYYIQDNLFSSCQKL